MDAAYVAVCFDCKWNIWAPTEAWAGDLLELHRGFTGHDRTCIVSAEEIERKKREAR